MHVDDFPRPIDDNRRGICWSASSLHPSGDALDYWLAELEAMQIKWVRVLDDGAGSATELCARLLAAGMMPIVCLQRGPEPKPDRLENQEVGAAQRLVAAGVRYFETSYEPDLAGARRFVQPVDWAQTVAERFITDAQIILGIGGLPALPALSMGSAAVLVEEVMAQGWGSLFAAGAWIALHAYTLNRPLDYPFEPVSQAGQPLSQEEYDRLGAWAWRGRPREVVNTWRAAGARPNSPLSWAGPCFLAWHALDEQIQRLLGYPVPMIATEGGPVVGAQDDARFPRLDARTHARLVERIDAFMSGREQVAGIARPPHFLALCYSLMANARLGHEVAGMEGAAWFTSHWDAELGLEGVLPAVGVLKSAGAAAAEAVRGMAGAGGETGTVEQAGLPAEVVQPAVAGTLAPLRPAPGPENSALGGKVLDHTGAPAAGIKVTLSRDGRSLQEAETDADGVFRFYRLAAGAYQVALGNVTVAGLALDGTGRRGLKLSLGEPGATSAQVEGVVRGGAAGATVSLSRDGEPTEPRTTTLDAEGVFAFAEVEPGRYTLALEGTGPVATGLELQPGGLYKTVCALQGRITGRVVGALPGSRATLHTPAAWGWTRQCLLAEDGSFAFQGLPAGRYAVQAAGATFVDVAVNGENAIELPEVSQTAGLGELAGQVRSAAGEPREEALLVLRRDGVFVAQARSAAGGHYAFARLVPGAYALHVDDGPAQDVPVAAGQITPYDVALPAAPEPAPAADGSMLRSLPPGEEGSLEESVRAEEGVAPGVTPVAPPDLVLASPDATVEAATRSAVDEAPEPEASAGLAAPETVAEPPVTSEIETPAPAAVPGEETVLIEQEEPAAPAEAPYRVIEFSHETEAVELPVAAPSPGEPEVQSENAAPADEGVAPLPEAEVDVAGLDQPPAETATEQIDAVELHGEPVLAPVGDADTGHDSEATLIASTEDRAEVVELPDETVVVAESAAARAPELEQTIIAAAEQPDLAETVIAPLESPPESPGGPPGPVAVDQGAEPETGAQAAEAGELQSVAPVEDMLLTAAGTAPAGGERCFIAHYMLFGAAAPAPIESARKVEADTRLALSLALEYLRRTGATGGFSLDEARRARRVTIVGDQVPVDVEQTLRAAGCDVTRLSGDGYVLAQGFARLLTAVGEG